MPEKKLVKKLDNLGLYVVEGDITQIDTDAIMTAINSGGLWFGGIDGAIHRVAGYDYHQQAARAMPLKNLQTIIAKGNKREHHGGFNDVIFVVDDLQSPLDRVIYTGLEAASKENYTHILVPAIRAGVVAGVYEKTPEETKHRFAKGIYEFACQYGAKTKLQDITFVFYRDTNSLRRAESSLSLLEAPKNK